MVLGQQKVEKRERQTDRDEKEKKEGKRTEIERQLKEALNGKFLRGI